MYTSDLITQLVTIIERNTLEYYNLLVVLNTIITGNSTNNSESSSLVYHPCDVPGNT
jgi:hypothetical protein